MVQINFPKPAFQIKKEAGKEFIYDGFRKKWIMLTPEEWVRQNFLNYLLAVKKYTAAFIAVEKEIRLGELKKRFDILVYDKHYQPWMMVECKSMDIQLNELVLQQLLRYNLSIPVQFLVITNGTNTYAWERKQGGMEPIPELPRPA